MAPLTDAVEREADKVFLRPEAVARVKTLAQTLDVDGRREAAVQVVIFAKVLWDGRQSLDVEGAMSALAQLVASLMGDVVRAQDAFAKAGIASAAALGVHREARAPRADDMPRPVSPVKTVRGLRKN